MNVADSAKRRSEISLIETQKRACVSGGSEVDTFLVSLRINVPLRSNCAH